MSRYDYQAIWDSIVDKLKTRIHPLFLKRFLNVRVTKGGEFILSKSYQWALKKFPSVLNEYRKTIRVLSFDNLDLADPPRMV